MTYTQLYLGGIFYLGAHSVRFEKGGHARGGIQGQPTLGGRVFSLSETCAWLEFLLAALDCYNWVLEEQLVAPSEVFLCECVCNVLLCACTYLIN